ncbi:site-specific DNA-methyltransferase, partial [Methanobrevibacter sp. OttesenSCG-928-I08]|nr:site-specific DNA-methyltransferase [Methanobrevibacter sp. OttesenSCG-928-I08]
EDKIDFDKLKSILGDAVDEDEDRYNFTWHGKKQAIAEAQKPSTGTLRPCKEESKNWDTTENLYIEGDNLEVLKLLQKSYYDKIKMIYIDPPYNTGNDFIYNDDYKDNLENYLKLTNNVDDDNNKITTNFETNGRFHTKWLNMIYPRLKLAKNLLKDDGVIFISIDDNEIDNLKKICDEIFGASNFIAHINRVTSKGSKSDSKLFISDNDYILVYSKNKDFVNFNKIKRKNLTKYPKSDKIGDYKLRSLEMKGGGGEDSLNDRPNMGYSIYYNPQNNKYELLFDYDLNQNPVYKKPNLNLINNGYICIRPKSTNGKLGRWRWSSDRFFKKIDDIEIDASKKRAYTKDRKKNFIEQSPNCNLEILNSLGTKEISNIFQNKIFDFPKPTKLIEYLLQIIIEKNDIILDFFAGSSTTAEAIINYNSKTNDNHKFIMVQLPEITDINSNAFKSGYFNICEIGKERIRRAGDKILEESENKDVDIGFKVFKLDSSNLQKWNPNYDNLEQTLIDNTNNIIEGRSEEDLIYEIMLKYGIDLTLPIKEYSTNENKKIYSIGFGTLLICLNNNITQEIANDILKIKNELKPAQMRVVFKDNGFKSDSDKTNIKETLKTNNIDEFVTI